MAEGQQGASMAQLMAAVGGILASARDAGLLGPGGVKPGATVEEWVAFAVKAFDIMADAGLTLADVAGVLKALGPIVGMFVK